MIFELPVTEERVKKHQITALHLICAFALLGIGAVTRIFMPAFWPWPTIFLVLGVLIIALNIFANKWLRNKIINASLRVVEVYAVSHILIAALILQMRVMSGMMGMLDLALVFALFWELAGNRPLFVSISERGFKLPITSRRRSIDWRDVDQVILKHSILTVNCIDNRLFQWNIKDSADVDNEIFEGFCDQQIELNKKRRIADW